MLAMVILLSTVFSNDFVTAVHYRGSSLFRSCLRELLHYAAHLILAGNAGMRSHL